MTRRNIIIIAAAVIFILLVGVTWFWFFSGTHTPPVNTGTFGSGGNKTANTTGNGTGNNTTGSSVLPSQQNNSSTGVGSPVGSGGSIGNGSTGNTNSQTQGVSSVPGVDWVGGSVSGGSPTSNFVPSTVNQLNDGSVGGTPGIVGSFSSGSSSGSNNGLLTGLLGAGIAGAGCALLPLFQTQGAAEATAKGAASLAGGFVLVYDFNTYSKAASKPYQDVWDCLARTIGKAVIAQMTNSIVNWINSGFNGQPSFVTNFQQYFTNVGDQAAGEFIRGTALSFLCSPFKAQIKIAIAQSYARRSAASCTLTGIIKNINGFMNGDFSQGGWGGLLQFTSIPTNNPYGAYAYAQAGLVGAQNNAVNNANRNITPGGFISLQKCDTAPGPTQSGSAGVQSNCKVVTPGAVIEDSLKDTLHQPFLANQLANSFDQIVSALLNQLVTKTLYNGLSTLSGTNGYSSNYLTPQEQQAQADAQTMLTDMQGRLQIAQQFGAVAQGSIGDIQNVQSQIQNVVNCWQLASSTPGLDAGKVQTAQADADAASATLHSYDSQIAAYNNTITRTNTVIAKLQDLQTQAISITSPGDVATLKAVYQTALSDGSLISQADVTNAQQDRVTLQATLTTRNQQTTADLNTCHAFH